VRYRGAVRQPSTMIAALDASMRHRLKVASSEPVSAMVAHAQVIKKSRFIAWCAPVGSFGEAQDFLRSVADPKVGHGTHTHTGTHGDSFHTHASFPHAANVLSVGYLCAVHAWLCSRSCPPEFTWWPVVVVVVVSGSPGDAQLLGVQVRGGWFRVSDWCCLALCSG
jgi:hypothetical protein